MFRVVVKKVFICVVVCLGLLCPASAFAVADGTSCSNAFTTLKGDYWFNENQSLWFTGSYNDLSEGFSCFWFSQDTLYIDAYYAFTFMPKCPGSVINTFKAVPNGTFELSPEYLQEKIREKCLEYLGMEPNATILNSIYANLHIYPKTGMTGRMFINDIGVAPQSTPAGPFSASEYKNYLVNANTNAYYQIAWKDDVKPDSVYVTWLPRDSADDFRADVHNIWPSFQFRQGSSTGASKGVAYRMDGENRYVVRNDAYQVAVSGTDSLFVSVINKSQDGYFSFKARYNNYKEPQQVELCSGKTLELNSGTYDQSGTYVDTLCSTCWHRTIRTFELSILPPVQGDEILLTVSSLPAEYDGEQFDAEGLYRLQRVTADGCDSIQPLRIKVEAALNSVENDALHLVPAQPIAGEQMTVVAAEMSVFDIYDMQGRHIISGRVGQPLVAPRQGIYLLRINGTTKKLQVK